MAQFRCLMTAKKLLAERHSMSQASELYIVTPGEKKKRQQKLNK